MAYRSSASNNVNDANLVITKPTGVVADDVLIAALWSDSASTTISSFSAFTAITGSPLTATLDGMRLHVGALLAGGSEPASYTFAASSGVIGFIAAFSGRDTTSYLHRIATGSSSASNASPWSLITGTYSGGNTSGTCDELFIGASDITPSNATTHTAPSGFTKQVDIQSAFYTGFLATKDASSSGATGAYTGTGTAGSTNAGWGAFAIALLVSGGGGGGGPVINDHNLRATRRGSLLGMGRGRSLSPMLSLSAYYRERALAQREFIEKVRRAA